MPMDTNTLRSWQPWAGWRSWPPVSGSSASERRGASDRLLARMSAVCAALPPRGAMRLARGVGALRRWTRPGEAAHVQANLAALRVGPGSGRGRIPGAAGIERETTATFEAFGLFLVEFLRGLSLTPAQILCGWEVTGLAHLERLCTQPGGFLLAGAHTGNWEQLGALAVLTGRRIVAPVETQLHPCLSPAIKRAKTRWGIRSVPARTGLRSLLAVLRAGELVALPLDGGAFRRGRRVPFGAARLRLAQGASRLARLAGCPIVPVFSLRTGFMQQRVRILRPLPPPPRADRRAEERLQRLLGALLYRHLRDCVGQWCLFRRLPWYD
ncbi:MAG: hypothetical protein GF330_12600 [Candidatus Eisenbacteria bacterium]|nr:hypothetical protein [Candidatus Eisenbacteria bacterium]